MTMNSITPISSASIAMTTSGELFGDVIGIHNFGAGDIIELKIAGTRRNRRCCSFDQKTFASSISRRPDRDRSAGGDHRQGSTMTRPCAKAHDRIKAHA